MMPSSAAMAEPGSTNQHDGRQHGAQFTDQRQRHRSPQNTFGAKLDQGIISMQTQHHANGNRCQADNGDRLHANEVNLLDDFGHLAGAR